MRFFATLDTSAPSVLAGTHTVVISDDTGINGDRITNDDQVKGMVFKATFNNISIISWGSVLLVKENGGPGENHRYVESH